MAVLAAAASAQADPITYYLIPADERTAVLPDPTQGGTVPVGSWMYPSISTTGSTAVYDPFNQPVSFEIRYSTVPPPQGGILIGYMGQPALDVTANISGWINYEPSASYWDREGGQFNMTGVSISLDPQANLADIPQALLGLLADPQRLHLIGPETLNEAGAPPDGEVTIDPPPPGSESAAPEPSTLVVVAAAFAALAVRHRWSKVAPA
jgi:hypothetical protein